MIDLKGHRVITPDGNGEVIEISGDKVEVKLDSGKVGTYASDDITEDSSAG